MSFGGYHALEVEANGIRKMQASSDYEPSRILMFLDALFTPVPRAFTAKEFHESSGWKVDRVNSGGLPLVRLSKSTGSQRADYTDSFFLLPSSGVLVMSNFRGLVTVWSDDDTFDGRVFAKEITIKNGDSVLLSARVSVGGTNEDDARLTMEGVAAEPGMTLRPLHASDVRMPDLSGSFSYITNRVGPGPVFTMTGVLDRHGRFREIEVLQAPNPKNAATIMDHFREEHAKPATIDGSQCQVRMLWMTM